MSRRGRKLAKKVYLRGHFLLGRYDLYLNFIFISILALNKAYIQHNPGDRGITTPIHLLHWSKTFSQNG